PIKVKRITPDSIPCKKCASIPRSSHNSASIICVEQPIIFIPDWRKISIISCSGTPKEKLTTGTSSSNKTSSRSSIGDNNQASVFSDSKSSCSAPANPFKREIASSKALSSKLCRSEERRVGKECRSRWARDNEKKKKKEEKI